MSIPATITRAIVLFAVLALGAIDPATAQDRRARVGDAMAPFTLPDLDGNRFEFQTPRERPAVLVFLAPHQKRSERAVTDLERIAAQLRGAEHPVDLLLILSGGEGLEYFSRVQERRKLDATMLIDADDALWGRLGVAVTPTTFLVESRGRIGWIRAGHSYDFAVTARKGLEAALGLAMQAQPADDAGSAAQPIEDISVRVDRHLRLGRVLARRGRVEAGIDEVRKADVLTPGASAVSLDLAQLLCGAGRPEEAITVLGQIEVPAADQRARRELIAGWAQRQLGELDEALASLESSVALDPRSARALFELGRVHEARGDCAQAMDAYRRALEIHHGERPGVE